jgi:deoxyribonuclease-4
MIEVSGGGKRLGVCLDSCHLYASGYEVRERKAFKSVVDRFDEVVGIGRLAALHMNDSMATFGSNRDRHANLGEGELGEEGLRVFLGEKRFRGLPVLLEVPGPDGHGPDKRQVDIAKRLREEAGAKRARAGRTPGSRRGRTPSRRRSAG